MTTKEKRAELRKDLARAGRGELLLLLLAAWADLDARDAVVEARTAEELNEETLDAIFGDES